MQPNYLIRLNLRSIDGGFTLVEVMVALTLLGLIATLVASGTRLGIDISARGTAKAEARRSEQMERGLIRSQLQGALPFRYWTDMEGKPIEHVAFEGQAERIRFVSRNGILDGPYSLPRWIDFHLKDTKNGPGKLVVEEHRILSPDNGPGEIITARAEVLDCIDVHFEYLDTTGEKPEWRTAWNNTDAKTPLPFAVRIQCKTPAREPMKLLIPLDYAESARQGMRLQ